MSAAQVIQVLPFGNMLFRLDIATQRVGLEKGPKDQAVIELTGVYHNLLRRWADA